MAPLEPFRELAGHVTVTTGPLLARHLLSSRDLTVKGAQGVTLGVIAAYVIIIALLWNIPYVRYVLWPFKVSTTSEPLCAFTNCCSSLLMLQSRCLS